MKTENLSKSELLQLIEKRELEIAEIILQKDEELEAIKFDSAFEQLKAEKKMQAITVNHSNLNNVITSIDIDVNKDDYRMIVRKSILRNYNEDTITAILVKKYSSNSDRSRTQSEAKKEDLHSYVKRTRTSKIANDILKEDAVIKHLKAKFTAKQYFAFVDSK